MNFETVENLSAEQINSMYDDIIEISATKMWEIRCKDGSLFYKFENPSDGLFCGQTLERPIGENCTTGSYMYQYATCQEFATVKIWESRCIDTGNTVYTLEYPSDGWFCGQTIYRPSAIGCGSRAGYMYAKCITEEYGTF